MRRLTISVDDELAETFDALVSRKGYSNRSEAFRDLVRREVEESRVSEGKARHCVAALSYVYNHHERELAKKLTALQHAHHDLTVSAMHAHLDHDDCIETVILRGPTATVAAFAEMVIAHTGVRHGKINLIPAQVDGYKAVHTHLHPHS